MKNPVIVVRFTVVERDALKTEHVRSTTQGIHLHRVYEMQEIAHSALPLGLRVAQEADKFWESAILMGVTE